MSIELTKNLVRLIDETTPYHKGEPSLYERLSNKRRLGLGFWLVMCLPIVSLIWSVMK